MIKVKTRRRIYLHQMKLLLQLISIITRINNELLHEKSQKDKKKNEEKPETLQNAYSTTDLYFKIYSKLIQRNQ